MAASTEEENPLEDQISCVKYTLFCFNIVAWALAVALFVLTVWLKAENGFNEWLLLLNAQQFYIGDYLLILVGVIAMAVAFLGCLSSLMENTLALFVFMGTQVLSFIINIVGSALLLQYSTMQGSLQPLLYKSINYFVSTSEYTSSAKVLDMIQDNLGCCGSTGPWDYWNVHQPLPASCRDAVSGNAFFSGCVDAITWFFGARTSWIIGLSLALGLLNVIAAVLSLVLVQAIKKEEKEAQTYRH